MLARHEQALQLSVLDHLREIDARRLYLRLGFSSLFDYTVRELRYTEAAAWRRIKAMRLCRETRGVRERPAGRLAEPEQRRPVAELLRALGAQRRRSARRRIGGSRTGRGRIGGSRIGGGRHQRRAARRLGSRGGAGQGGGCARAGAGCARAAAARGARDGKSTRQVQQMLAEVDPEAAAPAERLRPLGDGRWELKAVVDADCQRGLQQLRELLSHVDPHLTVGQLVGRLVREGVARYDPSQPPRRKRRKSDPAGDQCSAETAGREPADRVAAAAKNPRRAGKAAATTTCPAAPKQFAKATAVVTSPAVLPAGGCSGEAAPKRGIGPPPGSRTSAPKCVAPRAERAGSAGDAVATEQTSATKPRVVAGSSIAVPNSHGAASAKQTSPAELPRGSRQVDPGAEHPRRGIGRDARGGEVRKIIRQVDSGWGQARGLAARSGLLQLRRPAYRAALRLALLPGDRPHRAGRARRRRGAGKSQAPLFCPSPFPARSPAALRAARLGDVSKTAAPEIASARDIFSWAPSRGCRVLQRWWLYTLWRSGEDSSRGNAPRHRGPPGSMTSCRFRRSHPVREAR